MTSTGLSSTDLSGLLLVSQLLDRNHKDEIHGDPPPPILLVVMVVSCDSVPPEPLKPSSSSSSRLSLPSLGGWLSTPLTRDPLTSSAHHGRGEEVLLLLGLRDGRSILSVRAIGESDRRGQQQC